MEIVKAFTSFNNELSILIKGTIEDPLFRASDIASVLNISNIRAIVATYDDTEKTYIDLPTIRGVQPIIFLTESGLYNILFTSKSPIAKHFKQWVTEVIKDIRLNGFYMLQKENQQIQIENEKIKNENEILKLSVNKLYQIYIYNTNQYHEENRNIPILKIGLSTNINNRTKPYNSICHNGKIIYTLNIDFPDNIILENDKTKLLQTFEKMIHMRLSNFNIRNELFLIDKEEAISSIKHEYELFKIYNFCNKNERLLQLRKIENYHNSTSDKIYTNTISTQTETDYFCESISETKNNNKIKDFIDKCCLIHEDIEVSAKDIVGQYRLFNCETAKTLTAEITNYLQTHFKYTKLRIQDKTTVVMGYKGIGLKTIEYKKYTNISEHKDVETFIFEKYIFTPSGTELYKDIYTEYIEWKNNIKKIVDGDEEIVIKNYLKTNPYVLFDTVWASGGNGQGYYGLKHKKHIKEHRKSSTGCVVIKVDENNNLLAEYSTIAIASENEKISPAKMSRSIKNNVLFNSSSGKYMYKKK